MERKLLFGCFSEIGVDPLEAGAAGTLKLYCVQF